MLSRAIAEIRSAEAVEVERKRRERRQRQQVRTLDRWLGQVEEMLEEDRATVPEPLVGEIAGFLADFDPRLHRELLRIRTRDAVRVLDVLFEAQEAVLPGAAGRSA